MAFTEFCCRSGGSNLNAGTRTGNSAEPGVSPDFTYASGSWVAATGVFTVASGNPQTDGVAVGDFASVYADGASVTGFVGRVTARTTTTITVSLTARSGTAPTDGTSNRTLRIGGAWQGPNGASGFPLSIINGAMVNASGNPLRINFKNNQTYTISAQITASPSGFCNASGYATSYGDRGRATIATSGTASFTSLSGNGSLNIFDFVFDNSSFTSGFSNAVSVQAFCVRCVVISTRNNGFVSGFHTARFVECEAYGGAAGNNTALSFSLASGGIALRCIAHDVPGHGFGGSGAIIDCIADTVGNAGVASFSGLILGCTFYNTVGQGIVVATGFPTLILNTVFDTIGGFAVQCTAGGECSTTNIATRNLTSGVASGDVHQTGSIALSAIPFVDAPNGDFRLNSTAGGGAACRNAGIQSFLQTQPGYTGGTVGYPDLGAVEALASGGGGLFLPRAQNGGYSA